MKTAPLEIAELMNRFNEQGYLILPDVLSQDKVNRLNAAIDEVIAEEQETLAYNIYNSVSRHPEIASLIDHEAILPLIVNLLGHNIQLHISHLTVRKPNPNDVITATHSFIDWHQDGPHPQFPVIAGLTATYYIKVCYILSDMSQPNRGNTKVIPGSHKKPYNPNHKDVRLQLDGEVQVCGKPGDVFIFAQIDYHQADENLLKDADPIRRQLLGQISDNKFKYYVPEDSMVPLKSMLIGHS